jgi:hypothetical protein
LNFTEIVFKGPVHTSKKTSLLHFKYELVDVVKEIIVTYCGIYTKPRSAVENVELLTVQAGGPGHSLGFF